MQRQLNDGILDKAADVIGGHSADKIGGFLFSTTGEPMNHRDAEITEVVVVIHKIHCEKLDETVEKLKAFGVEVFSTDEEECIVSGSIETYKLPELEKIECVNYVRSVMTYIADFPVGDTRDKDLADDDDEDAAEAV